MPLPSRPGLQRSVRDAAKQRVHLLDVPFAMRGVAQAAGAAWNAKFKAFAYTGDPLPAGLQPFSSRPHSWERFQETLANGMSPEDPAPETRIQPREHQVVAAKAILNAYERDRCGFLLADDVGLGKTISTWLAIQSMPDIETVLIVCPLAVVAHWRQTITRMGSAGKRVVVINYDRLKLLFEVLPVALRKGRKIRKVRTQKGIAKFGEAQAFDLVVADESHRLRNLETARTKLMLRLQDQADFLVWLSATAGQHPLELAYLSPLLGERTGARNRDLKDFEAWCVTMGIGVVRGAFGKWTWRGDSKDPAERQGAHDNLATMRRLLFEGDPLPGLRRRPSDIQGWPSINRILLPVALDVSDRALYENAWTEFREQLGLENAGVRDPKSALVARLRFRQKASLLRTAATVDLALELLRQCYQVAISLFFKETLRVIKEALEATGHGVSVIDGSMTGPEKERERLDFQFGRKTVCCYTVKEGISLHQGEHNDAPRANLLADLPWTAISAAQREGRTFRDGQFSLTYWLYGEDTVERDIAELLASRVQNMAIMHGDPGAASDVEGLLRRLAH